MSLFTADLLSLIFPTQCIACQASLDRSGEQLSDPSAVCDSLREVSFPNSSMGFASPVFQLAPYENWCRDCWRQLGVGSQLQCVRCSAQLDQPSPFEGKCAHCFEFDFRFARSVSLGNYRGLLQRLVVEMKNHHDDQLAIQLASLLANVIRVQDFFDTIDMIVPVPVNWRRRLTRGFCAAEIVAETIGQILELPVRNSWVQSARLTEKQGQLSLTARKSNVRNAFQTNRKADFENATVLIVDDVMTSGATVNEVTRVLQSAKAANVYVATLARATGVR